MILLIGGLLLGGSLTLMLWALQRDPSGRVIQKRLYREMGEDPTKSRSGLKGFIKPFVQLHEQFKLTKTSDVLAKHLAAGRTPLTATEFLVVKELMAGFGVLAYFCVTEWRNFNPTWVILWAAIGFFVPDFWLKQRIGSRRRSMARDLPEVVDLLSLCVTAGADLMGGLQRIVREYRPCPLREELTLMLQEVSVGKRRREAFKALSERANCPEVTQVCRTIIHADRMGTGMVQALTVMSEDMRMLRSHQAERFAQQAPLKMLFPLLLIMASVLITVAGPILIQFLTGRLVPKF